MVTWNGSKNMKRYNLYRVKELYRQIRDKIQELENECPGRKFTIDGLLLGSIGEVMAFENYDLDLLETGKKSHDAVATKDGRFIQIKTTQGDTVSLKPEYKHLLVLKIDSHGDMSEIYNGPNDKAIKHARKMDNHGYRQIKTDKLHEIMNEIKDDEKISGR